MAVFTSIEQIDERLHDGEIYLDALEINEGNLRIRGEVPGAYRGRHSRQAFELQFFEVSQWNVEDGADIGIFVVDGFERTSDGFEIVSPLPMKISIATPSNDLRLLVEDLPFKIRRFARWTDV
jgi:hypothetical protein